MTARRVLWFLWATVTVVGVYYAGVWSEAGHAGAAALCVASGVSAGALVWQVVTPSRDRSPR